MHVSQSFQRNLVRLPTVRLKLVRVAKVHLQAAPDRNSHFVVAVTARGQAYRHNVGAIGKRQASYLINAITYLRKINPAFWQEISND